MKKIILRNIIFTGADGFKCAVCGAPSGDVICPSCKAKNGC